MLLAVYPHDASSSEKELIYNETKVNMRNSSKKARRWRKPLKLQLRMKKEK